MSVVSNAGSTVMRPSTVHRRSRRLAGGGFVLRVMRRPLAAAASVYLILVVAASIVAPLLAPYSSTSEDLLHELSGPTAAHWLGTDELGRDVLSRLLFGGRVTLLAVGEATVVFVAVGLPLGLVAGFFGGWVDRAVMYATELLLSIPGFLLLLVVAAVFSGDLLILMITLGLVATPSIVRVVRAAVLEVRQEPYVRAAQVVGLSRLQILRRHVLPRVAGPAIVQSMVFAASAVIIEAILGYLSLDTAPPTPSWGSMMAEGSQEIAVQAWLIVPPGLAVALTVLALGLLGDAFRDASVERWAPSSGARSTSRRAARRVLRQQRQSSRAAEASYDPAALLSVRDLSVAFPAKGRLLTVVEGVSFDVARGEIVGIVGESGCGKSATAHAVLGVLPGGGAVSSGRVVFAGRDLLALSSSERHRLRGKSMALVSQDPILSLDPLFPVGRQLVEAIRRHRSVSRPEARRLALELLDLVRLADPSDVAQRYAYQLSGGMAQRVCIAVALAGQPQLLVADEPTTALDVTVQAEILDLLTLLREDMGLSVLIVSHDWGVIADVCDRVLVMYAGQIVEDARVAELFRQPLHPYSEGLMAANPHLAVQGDSLPSIPGMVPAPGEWPPGCRFWPRCSYATDECREQSIELLEPQRARKSRCLHWDRLAAGMASVEHR